MIEQCKAYFGNLFFLKKLFYLSGIYLALLFINQLVLSQSFASYLRHSSLVIQILFFYIPLLFHIASGIVLFFPVRFDVFRHSNVLQIRFILVRVSAILSSLFLIWLLYKIYTLSQENLNQPFDPIIFLTGMICVLFYFCFGFWDVLIDFGIAANEFSQKIVLFLCSVIFCVFLIQIILS